MAWKDLREYLKRLEEEGELVRIGKEVDWNLEAGAIIRRSTEIKAPAPLFENIKGYGKGYRIFGGSLGTSNKPGRYWVRLALTLGMDPETKVSEIIEECIKRKKNPIKPVIVNKGVCKENIDIGDQVDLLKFPVPFIHEGDGGRYIGTWHIVVTKDLDTDWVNWGMYRLMIHDEKTMGGAIHAQRDIGRMYFHEYEPRNKPMEFAVALGSDPVIPLVGCCNLEAYVNEYDYAGGLRGEAVELVKCETVDLYVPANSEIVIEGEILPHERKDEGPFGEYTGYSSTPVRPRPIFRVKAVTHRNDPILPVSCMGVPVDDGTGAVPVTHAAEILYELRERNLPVKMVYCPPEGVSHMAVVSTKTPYPNFAKNLAAFVWTTKAGSWIPYLIVTDEDVDVTNMEEVIHALTSKCHPYRGIHKFKDAPGSHNYPMAFLSVEDRVNGTDMGNVLFDCTWPKTWPPEVLPIKSSFDVIYPKDIQEKVLKNWSNYGYR